MKIPKSILNKPGKLTNSEFETIKQHPKYGYQILASTKQLQNIAKAVFHHHEKFNGTGYPAGKAGKDIPFISRILMIADVYEAMTSDRSYRKAMTKEMALKIISDEKGGHFDPILVDTFLTLFSNSSPYEMKDANFVRDV